MCCKCQQKLPDIITFLMNSKRIDALLVHVANIIKVRLLMTFHNGNN